MACQHRAILLLKLIIQGQLTKFKLQAKGPFSVSVKPKSLYEGRLLPEYNTAVFAILGVPQGAHLGGNF